jgi:hypothetical protein
VADSQRKMKFEGEAIHIQVNQHLDTKNYNSGAI